MEISKVINFLEEIAPVKLSENWDNVGLLVGDFEREIFKVLICLDVTNEVVQEAISEGVDLIISHHPVIFSGIKAITNASVLGKKILDCIKNDIALYAMHTNFDIAEGGTNDILFDLLELYQKENMSDLDDQVGYSIGRIGELWEAMPLKEFAKAVKQKLNLEAINYVGDDDQIIKRVAVCTGSGIKYYNDAIEKQADVFITSDIGHHQAMDAIEMGISLIDATHYATEFIMVKNIKDKLQNAFENEIIVLESKENKPIFKIV